MNAKVTIYALALRYKTSTGLGSCWGKIAVPGAKVPRALTLLFREIQAFLMFLAFKCNLALPQEITSFRITYVLCVALECFAVVNGMDARQLRRASNTKEKNYGKDE